MNLLNIKNMIKIDDFTYKKDGLFSIDHNKKIPKTFYKYYALTENSVDAVTTPYLYASHPYQLNDPLDCGRHIIEFDEELSTRMQEELKKSCMKKGLEEAIYQHEGKAGVDFSSVVFDILNFRKYGIFSMTEDCNEELMWVHYAGKEGFCVELDVNQFNLSKQPKIQYYGPFPINYQKNIKSVKITKKKDIRVAMAVQCNIKRGRWDYEKEWRLIIRQDKKGMKTFGKWDVEINNGSEHGRKFNYNVKAIKKVIFRQDFFEAEEMRFFQKDKYENQTFVIGNKLKRRLLNFIVRNQIPIGVQYYNTLCDKYEIRNATLNSGDGMMYEIEIEKPKTI